MLLLALAFFSFSSSLTGTGSDTFEESLGSGGSSDRVALIELTTPITESETIVRQFRKYQNRSSVKAIVLRLDSPGGSVSPSQEILQEVKRTRELGKPVVVSMGSVAASGAYYIACGASRIVANPGTITGSIGVISQFMSYDGLMEKIGVSGTTVKSGRYKDVGNPMRKMTEEDVEQIRLVIDDVYEQFMQEVATSRSIPLDSVRVIAQGRIYTGKQAYALKLVDTLGTLQTAVQIAGILGKVEGEPKILRERKRQSLAEQLFGTNAKTLIKDVRDQAAASSPLEFRMSY
jgi:protease-4